MLYLIVIIDVKILNNLNTQISFHFLYCYFVHGEFSSGSYIQNEARRKKGRQRQLIMRRHACVSDRLKGYKYTAITRGIEKGNLLVVAQTIHYPMGVST